MTDEQQRALLRAGEKAEVFFRDRAKGFDTQAEEVFAKAGVEVVHMSPEQVEMWRALARETSYQLFTEEVESGRALLDLALTVE